MRKIIYIYIVIITTVPAAEDELLTSSVLQGARLYIYIYIYRSLYIINARKRITPSRDDS